VTFPETTGPCEHSRITPAKCVDCLAFPGRLDEEHNAWLTARIRRRANQDDDESDPETWGLRAHRAEEECDFVSGNMHISDPNERSLVCSLIQIIHGCKKRIGIAEIKQVLSEIQKEHNYLLRARFQDKFPTEAEQRGFIQRTLDEHNKGEGGTVRRHKKNWKEELFSELAIHVYGNEWKDDRLKLLKRLHGDPYVRGTTLPDRFTYEIDELDKIIKHRLSDYLISSGIKYDPLKPYANVVNYIIHRRSFGIHDKIRDMCFWLGKTDTGPESLHEDQAAKLIRELSKRDMWPLKGALSESDGGGRLKTRKFKKSKSKSKSKSKRGS